VVKAQGGTLGCCRSVEVTNARPYSVAAIVRALRHVHGDDIARAMLTNGTTLAALIDALLHSPLTNRNAAKLMTQALRSNDFIVTPDFGSVWHIKYVYDRPKSLNVVDLAVITLDHGIFASTDIRLLLAIDRVVKQRGMDDAGATSVPGDKPDLVRSSPMSPFYPERTSKIVQFEKRNG
jgi:hypothetical protein